MCFVFYIYIQDCVVDNFKTNSMTAIVSTKWWSVECVICNKVNSIGGNWKDLFEQNKINHW